MTQELYVSVSEKCSPFICREECYNYMMKKREEACFHGDAYDVWRFYSTHERNDTAYFFSQLESCDMEIWRAKNGMDGGKGGWSSDVTRNMASLLATSIMVFTVVMF